MPALINRTGVLEDTWPLLDDKQALPTQGNCIVDVDRWLELRAIAETSQVRFGVRIKPTTDIANLQSDLNKIDLVAIPFGVFSDGRGFSQARLLRERLGFVGIVRAVGDVLPDQLAFMARCGVDQFELAGSDEVEQALHAFAAITVGYQVDVRGGTRQRHNVIGVVGGV